MEDSIHFAIAVPHYTPGSNGVVLLYSLGEYLAGLGHKVSFVPIDRPLFETHRSVYSAGVLARFVPDPADVPPESIAIFAETVPRELIAALPSRRRVFYLLNRPYTLTGQPLSYRLDDLVIAYSGLISKARFNLFLANPVREFEQFASSARPAPAKEPLVLLYFGKSRTDKIPEEVGRIIQKYRAEVVVMNRVFPASRDTLFDLLRRARLLVTFDPLTNLSYEATLCGTPSFIADNYMNLRYADYNIPLLGFFEDPREVESRYQDGLTPQERAQISQHYYAALAANTGHVQQFVEMCRDWFSLTQRAPEVPGLAALLESHNRLRLELDRSEFMASGGKVVGHAFQSFTPASFGSSPLRKIGNYMVQRKDRLVWNMKRNWYKHITGLRGEALTAKLEKMSREYELRKLGPRHAKAR